MISRTRARRGSAALAGLVAVFLALAAPFAAGPAGAAGGVSATATVDGRAIAGATASNPVRLDPKQVVLVVVEVNNGTADPVSVRRVDLAGHVLGLNFYSYSTTVELTVAAGKTEKLTYRLDPAGLDGQATGLVGSDLTLIGGDGKPLTSVHTVVDVRGSLVSVYGLFGIIIAVLTGLAIADAALTVARHRLSANRWQRGLRLLAPGIGIGLMIGFTASVARWWVPGTVLWLSLAGGVAAVFFLVGYLSPTPRQSDDLGLDPEDLAAAKELDAMGFAAATPDGPISPPVGFPVSPGPSPISGPPGPNPPYGGTFPDLAPVGQPGGTFRDLPWPGQPGSEGETQKIHTGNRYPGNGPLASAMEPNSGGMPTVSHPADLPSEPGVFGETTIGRGVDLGKNTPVPIELGEDEPTIRSAFEGQGFSSGGAGR
ncbi:hypothetical protein VMT65_29545 [Nocardia sp. CDC153]|uniref:hypothetical protein n=1 Tax=Nocardia sp. CDC153 TaxID=3112167 RepID=UPI002DB84092|nr:hypothetical protein [Nocardia sp. CDC153]MEC3957210.1 hypothetical protein [Nocardia sp. CDC153]